MNAPQSSQAIELAPSADRLLEAFVVRLLATADLPGGLAKSGVPPAALDAIVARLDPSLSGSEWWRTAVGADRDRAERSERARRLVEDALVSFPGQAALSRSILGSLWDSGVDVVVGAADLPPACAALESAGFLDVQPLLVTLGLTRPGVHRYGAIDGGDVLAPVELRPALRRDRRPEDDTYRRESREDGGLPHLAPAEALRLLWAEETAATGPPLRFALELLTLLETGQSVPHDGDLARALRRCAALERELIGDGGLLARAAADMPRTPDLRRAGPRIARGRRELRRRLRPSRLVVAFSGIDGAGKSTQAALLVHSLGSLGVPARSQWIRIGYGGSRLLPAVARLGRKLLSMESGDAMRARAAGASDDAHATRRGVLGWSWALAVTLNFLALSWRTVRRVRGAVLASDRALPDALVGLEEGYGGAVPLGLQRRLMERLAPQADITFYLRIAPDVAYARKEDIFAAKVLEDHARTYDEILGRLPGTTTLDSSRPIDDLALEVLRLTLDPPRGRRGG